MKTIMGIAAAALLAALGSVASAGIISIQEVGSDVVVTGSGSFDTTGLMTPSIDFPAPAHLIPDAAVVVLGGPSALGLEAYADVTGPAAWGPASELFFASSGTGLRFGVQGFRAPGGGRAFLFVPQDYVSGDFLSGTSTYSGQSFATLSLTEGTYVYTWGTGANADSLTVQIGDVQVVPLPPAAFMGLGLLGLIGLGRKLKRRRSA